MVSGAFRDGDDEDVFARPRPSRRPWLHSITSRLPSSADPLLLAALAACVLLLLDHAYMASRSGHDLARSRAKATSLRAQLSAQQEEAAQITSNCQLLHMTLKIHEPAVWEADADAQALHKELKHLTLKFNKMRRQNLLVADTGGEGGAAAGSAVARMDAVVYQLGLSLDAANALLAAEDETSNTFKKLAVWVAGSGLAF